jgi:HK97 gp10 family phage protein
MKFEMSLEGVDGLSKELEKLAKESGNMMARALIEAGFRIQREAKTSIAKSPMDPITGRSMPGNAPKTDRGTLVNSIYVNAEKAGENVQAVIVGTDLKYGEYLEFGTKFIQARPWLVPAFAATRQKNLDALKSAITRFVREKGAG